MEEVGDREHGEGGGDDACEPGSAHEADDEAAGYPLTDTLRAEEELTEGSLHAFAAWRLLELVDLAGTFLADEGRATSPGPMRSGSPPGRAAQTSPAARPALKAPVRTAYAWSGFGSSE